MPVVKRSPPSAIIIRIPILPIQLGGESLLLPKLGSGSLSVIRSAGDPTFDLQVPAITAAQRDIERGQLVG